MLINNADDTEVMDQDGENVDEIDTETDEGDSGNSDTQDNQGDQEDWRARALKAEGILKRKKKQTVQNRPQQTNNQSIDPNEKQELRLLATGMSEEEISQAKVIAKGTGKTLSEAIKDPLFTAYQDKIKEDRRKEQARLGASQGSDYVADENAAKSGMTDEEHKALWKKSIKT